MSDYNSNTVIYLNGQFVKASEATINPYSQSLHYGYAAFEGIRAYKSHNTTCIFKAREHYERLQQSCQLMGIPFVWDIEELIRQTYRLLELNRLKDAYIKPLVYNISSNMAYTSPHQASIMIYAWEWGAYYSNRQLKVGISSIERPNPSSIPTEAKITSQHANAILATTEARNNDFDEAIQIDMYGYVAQAPTANIFIEKNGKLYTPAKGNILPGITRAALIELCGILDIEIEEKNITIEFLKNADGAFLCSTSSEVIGIHTVDEIVYRQRWRDSIGATLQRAYKNLVLEKANYEVII